MRNLLFALFIFTLLHSISAQRAKDGDKVTSGNEVVNAYTSLTLDASAGDTSLTVSSSNLNNNFSSSLAAGDLIMIIQVQGATIDDANQFIQGWGAILNYNTCGNYEFAQVKRVPNATTIDLDCELQNSYSQAGKTMIVRVPRFNTLTVNSGDTIKADAWNGSIGGIVAIEVLGTTTINGSISSNGVGFRGGQTENNSLFGGLRYADGNAQEGAEKGEGIGGSQTDYDALSGRYCRGAAANGGGGGNGHNSGGAGGANAGDLALWNKGIGNPDVSTANFITAWTRDTNITLLNADPTLITSSGGGRGGYSHCSSNQNAINIGPNSGSWSGDQRRDNGGLGGRPLDYSTGKIFMGGAGGAGDANDIHAGAGGNGAGIVFLKTYDNISGIGSIDANGNDGGDCSGPTPAPMFDYSGKDAAGGGGAGGTIIVQTTGSVNSITLNANGGKGGDQIMTAGTFGSIQEAEGPGGGGGGGYVAISAGSPTINVNGGINGTTNSPLLTEFPPNGATMGGVGLDNGSINSFDLTANGTSICPNTSTTLNANISGSAPGGALIEWYDAEFDGNLLQTGSSFTTPVLSVNTTYYVKTCPGDFTIAVDVTINACGTPPIASFSASDSTICEGDCISFTDLSTNTPSGWTWYFFGADSTTSSLQNPSNICYSSAGSFDVALVASNPSGSDSLFMAGFITVSALPTIITTPDTAICIGDTLNLTASGGNTYTWDNGLGSGANQTVAPVINTTYEVIVTTINGCVDSAEVDVTINSLPTVVANANNTSICSGDSLLLFGSGATTYTWDNSVIDSVKFTPASSNTYTVTGTDANGCENTDQILVTVGACGVPPIANFGTLDTNICIGDCISFVDSSANFPTNWTWYFPGSDSASSNVQNPSNICYNTVGSFDVKLVVTNASGADSITFVNYITVNTLPTVVASNDTAICIGDAANLSATGATTYDWDNGLGAGQTQNPSPIVNTTYIVTGTDANGCVNTDQVDVSINALPIVITSADTSVCLGDAVNLTATGGSIYDWDNGLGLGQNQSPTPTVNTVYNVVVTDANGCSNTGQVNVSIDPIPTIVANNDTTICNGQTVLLMSTGGAIYSWDNGLGLGALHNVTPAVNTTYTVTGYDANGCSNTDQVVVTVDACLPPVAAFSVSDSTICINDCVDFTDLSTNSPDTWTWYFFNANTLTSIDQNPIDICYSTTGTFDVKLVVSNVHGADSVTYTNLMVVDSCNTPVAPIVVEVIVPNVFTPNVDGQNDLFNISGTGITELNLKIFNRWGEMLFETNQLNEGWNGRTTAGAEVPDGTYFYVAKVTTLDGVEEHNGTVTLIR